MRAWRSWLIRVGDTPDEARIKTLGFPFAIFIFLVSLVTIAIQLKYDNQLVVIVGMCFNASAMAIFMAGVVSNLVPAGYLMDVWLALCTVGILANDLGSATISSAFRSWTFVVLLLDCALIFNRDRMIRPMITFILMYMAAMHVESVQRFGLYEVGYWGTGPEEISTCSCASPPCDSNPIVAFFTLLGVCTVFLGDFFLTKGFARGMTFQLRRVEASVDVAGVIADALARYD
eukprot:Hpha_TRINITY_DN16088_c7_g9::TRINITY_DN16088_c7_g9_i2::g.121599::m.121599